jgi:hypothetical protein
MNHKGDITFILNKMVVMYTIYNTVKNNTINEEVYNMILIIFYKIVRSIENGYEYDELIDDILKKSIEILYYISK